MDKVEYTEFNLTPKRAPNEQAHETVVRLGRQIEALLAALSGIEHCEKCVECANIAYEARRQYHGLPIERLQSDASEKHDAQ
jgi:hypothetical protein